MERQRWMEAVTTTKECEHLVTLEDDCSTIATPEGPKEAYRCQECGSYIAYMNDGSLCVFHDADWLKGFSDKDGDGDE